MSLWMSSRHVTTMPTSRRNSSMRKLDDRTGSGSEVVTKIHILWATKLSDAAVRRSLRSIRCGPTLSFQFHAYGTWLVRWFTRPRRYIMTVGVKRFRYAKVLFWFHETVRIASAKSCTPNVVSSAAQPYSKGLWSP